MSNTIRKELQAAGFEPPTEQTLDRVVVALFRRGDGKRVYLIGGELYERTDAIMAISKSIECEIKRDVQYVVSMFDRQFGNGDTYDNIRLTIRADVIEIAKHDEEGSRLAHVVVELWDGEMRDTIYHRDDCDGHSIVVCRYKPPYDTDEPDDEEADVDLDVYPTPESIEDRDGGTSE